jgi:predicted nucleotide-binding protein (sugar kinase/HSP70/actin superfamily)
MKENIITIKLTGNDLFYHWLKGIKEKLVSASKEKDIKELKKELKKVINLFD